MQVTFDLPDEVVIQLRPFEDKLPQILELGLRELHAIAQEGFSGSSCHEMRGQLNCSKIIDWVFPGVE
jgi:hypothetical protein